MYRDVSHLFDALQISTRSVYSLSRTLGQPNMKGVLHTVHSLETSNETNFSKMSQIIINHHKLHRHKN